MSYTVSWYPFSSKYQLGARFPCHKGLPVPLELGEALLGGSRRELFAGIGGRAGASD